MSQNSPTNSPTSQPLPKAALNAVADHISKIITSGTDNQRKALIETGYWHDPPRPESAWTGYADG